MGDEVWGAFFYHVFTRYLLQRVFTELIVGKRHTSIAILKFVETEYSHMWIFTNYIIIQPINQLFIFSQIGIRFFFIVRERFIFILFWN